MLTEIKWFAEMTKIFFILLSDACSVTRYGEIRHFGMMLPTFGHFERALLVFGKMLNLLM